MEEILVIIGEEPEQPSVDNYTYDTQPVEELNVS
jgi:hypothetical protein